MPIRGLVTESARNDAELLGWVAPKKLWIEILTTLANMNIISGKCHSSQWHKHWKNYTEVKEWRENKTWLQISKTFKPYSLIKRKHVYLEDTTGTQDNAFDICRFCLYPQELVLLMKEPIRVRKLQLLSHQFMICKCSLLLILLPQKYSFTLCPCGWFYGLNPLTSLASWFIFVTCETPYQNFQLPSGGRGSLLEPHNSV